MDILSLRRLRAGIDKEEIPESKRGINPTDISASKMGADMDMLSVRRLRAGIDKEEISESKRGIDPMDISDSKLGADMDMLSARRRALRLWCSVLSLGVRCFITAARSLPPCFSSWEPGLRPKMGFALSASVATTRAEAMMNNADFIMAILKTMQGDKVADALPFTICGLCEEGGKDDGGGKVYLRPVLRIFSSDICEVVPKNRRRKKNPYVSSFEKHATSILLI
jgi:hypothetical protein